MDILSMSLLALKTKEEKYAYLQGYLDACDNYAIWHDGERLLGCGIKTFAQEKKIVEELLKDIEEGKI